MRDAASSSMMNCSVPVSSVLAFNGTCAHTRGDEPLPERTAGDETSTSTVNVNFGRFSRTRQLYHQQIYKQATRKADRHLDDEADVEIWCKSSDMLWISSGRCSEDGLFWERKDGDRHLDHEADVVLWQGFGMVYGRPYLSYGF